MPAPIIPVGVILPLITAALELLFFLKDVKDIDPEDKDRLLKLIDDSQAKIQECIDKWKALE